MKCYIAVEDQDNQYSIKVDDNIAQDIYKIILRVKFLNKGKLTKSDYKKILRKLDEQIWDE